MSSSLVEGVKKLIRPPQLMTANYHMYSQCIGLFSLSCQCIPGYDAPSPVGRHLGVYVILETYDVILY